MSVYTTELRYICEHDAGLKESVGLNQIDDVIAACRESIFGDYPIFDEDYRATLETMILKHYYMWEIGAETVGLFKLWLNERMNEIMPKYNLMYSALDFIAKRAMPFDDTDLQTTHEGQDDTVGSSSGTVSSSDEESSSRAEQETGSRAETETGSKTETETGSKAETETGTSENATSNTSASNQTNTTDHLNKYADTPQGGLSGLLNDTYLTNATKDDGTDTTNTSATAAAASAGSDSREKSGTDTRARSGADDRERAFTDTRARSGADQREGSRNEQHNDANTVLNVRQYVEHVTGRRGGQSFYSEFYEMIEKLKSIDQMIIRDLQDLFMGVW